MTTDGNLDSLVDDIAELASVLLDAQPAATGSGEVPAILLRLEEVCAQHLLQGAVYVFRLLRKFEPRRPAAPLQPDDAERIERWIGNLTAYVMAPGDPANSAVVLDDLLSLSWIPPLPDDLTQLVRERLVRDAVRLAAALLPSPSEPEAQASGAVGSGEVAPLPMAAAGGGGQEPLPTSGLLVAAPDQVPVATWITPDELALMIDAVSTQLLPLAANVEAQDTVAGQQQSLADYREQFALISSASDALGLPGLSQVCALFALAQDHCAADAVWLDEDQRRLLGEWPVFLIGYLQAPTEAAPAADLVALFRTPGQAWSLDEASARALQQELNRVAVGNDPALVSERKVIAEPADVALEIAADVLPGVLSGMLQELPGRSAEFSIRIQRYVRAGAAQDLDTAQRIAHTLKGDGNIVGVRGIANLTHALEEILLDLASKPGPPPPELGEILVEAADCLDAMSDFVLKRGPAPPNALAVLQSVLDWANALHGLSVAAVPVPAAEPGLAPIPVPVPDVPVSEEAAEPESEPIVSVPARLLDQLLRLIGEAVIYARQIENRVERISRRTADITAQNQALQGLIGELQQLVEVRGAAAQSSRLTLGEELDALEMERYNELHTVTLRLVEAGDDARTTGGDVSEDVSGLRDLLSLQDRIHLDLQDRVLRTRTLPVSGLLPRLQRVVRQTARQLGKECEIEFLGETVELDHEIIERLAEPLVHLLRNAVDHGIEYAEQRAEQGKPRCGRIELSFRRDAGVVRILCRDDGRGLDIAAIRRKGIERELLDPALEVSDELVSQLIFRPGFSTRNEATQTSGRGIGMDVVHHCIAQLKGSLALHSEPGRGCEFEIQLPASQVVADVLLAYTAVAPVAILLHGIERLAVVERGDLIEEAGALTARLDALNVPAYSLEALLGYPARVVSPGVAHTVLMARTGARGNAAVLVGQLGEARSVIVKSLGACVPPLPGVLGATILGDGSVAPVVDLQELIGIYRRLAQGFRETLAETVDTLPRVLVVDDSLSVRRSLEQLVSDAGFKVATARDGLEAVERLREHTPDLVLVDMEMPRMNGLELTSFIRKNESTRTIPVIMITSRTTERHRDLARQAGVDLILSKPYSEEELLDLIGQRIGAAV
ncbi:MAG: response regulator [Rhodanobacteraceae bacterium]|nr:response regulator [Rhodanobacteraceae bacterium]